MNIGEVSERTGLPVKTIRYYEDIDLVTPGRAPNGYRVYNQRDLHKLAFVGRSRDFGFSIEECRSLLSLYTDESRASADVKRMTVKKIEEIETKMQELASLKNTLQTLAATCHGNNKPDCPILADLAGEIESSKQ